MVLFLSPLEDKLGSHRPSVRPTTAGRRWVSPLSTCVWRAAGPRGVSSSPSLCLSPGIKLSPFLCMSPGSQVVSFHVSRSLSPGTQDFSFSSSISVKSSCLPHVIQVFSFPLSIPGSQVISSTLFVSVKSSCFLLLGFVPKESNCILVIVCPQGILCSLYISVESGLILLLVFSYLCSQGVKLSPLLICVLPFVCLTSGN